MPDIQGTLVLLVPAGVAVALIGLVSLIVSRARRKRPGP